MDLSKNSDKKIFYSITIVLIILVSIILVMDYSNILINRVFTSTLIIISILFLLGLISKNLAKYYTNIIKYKIINIKTAKYPISIHRNKLPFNYNIQNQYSFSLWLNINDWQYMYNKPKHIFHIGDCNANFTCPGVWFDKKFNNLIIKAGSDDTTRYTSGKIGVEKGHQCKFPYKWNYNKLCFKKPNHITDSLQRLGYNNINNIPDTLLINDCESTQDSLSPEGYCPIELDNSGYVSDIKKFGSCNIIKMNPYENKNFFCDKNLVNVKNIPIGRWFHLVITFRDKTMEIYINGKLVETKVFYNSLSVNNGNLYINKWNGFSGLLSCFNLYPFALKYREVSILYSKGPKCYNNKIKKNCSKLPRLKFESGCKLCS